MWDAHGYQVIFPWLGIGFQAWSSIKCRPYALELLDGEREFWRSVRCSGYRGVPVEFLDEKRELTQWVISQQDTRLWAEGHLPTCSQGRGTGRAGMKTTRDAPLLGEEGAVPHLVCYETCCRRVCPGSSDSSPIGLSSAVIEMSWRVDQYVENILEYWQFPRSMWATVISLIANNPITQC